MCDVSKLSSTIEAEQRNGLHSDFRPPGLSQTVMESTPITEYSMSRMALPHDARPSRYCCNSGSARVLDGRTLFTLFALTSNLAWKDAVSIGIFCFLSCSPSAINHLRSGKGTSVQYRVCAHSLRALKPIAIVHSSTRLQIIADLHCPGSWLASPRSIETHIGHLDAFSS